MSQPNNTIILPTIHGDMLVNRNDINQTLHFLQRYAAIDNDEIKIIADLALPGTAAIDVGTCFGAWTLELAKRAAVVYSFEAQRYLCNCLSGSLALNSIENVFVFNFAVGAYTGIANVPQYDLGKPLQHGCVYLCPRTEHGDMEQEPKRIEPVQMVALDNLSLQNVSLIKIDVEGMELDVLRGAEKLISENKPSLYVEYRLSDKKGIEEFLEQHGYIFTDNDVNLLAVHKSKFSLEKLESGDTRITQLNQE